MITVMISGSIAKQPERRTSKNGNSYCLASIKVQSAEGDMYASITAFSNLSAILAGMQKGDPVTVIGQGKVSTYQGRDGDTKAGLSITASRIITIADHQAPPKPKGDGQTRKPRPFTEYRQPDQREYAGDEFADEIPF